MPSFRVAVWIKREDYPAFAELMPSDPEFPHTFDEWDKMTSEVVAKLEAQGTSIKKIVVDPKEFAHYCKQSGLAASSHVLGAFAVALDTMHDTGLTPISMRRHT